MSFRKALALTLLAVFAASGCTPQKMYFFGNYSQTLYSLEKSQNDESLTNHKQELEKIITESEKRSLPVPPGIYAELGYIHLKAGESKEAIKLFEVESQLYPESKQLMARLIQSATAKENNESEQ